MNLKNDTVAALSTPAAPAGLGVLRIAGSDAVAIADRVFFAQSKKPLAALRGYRAAFGHVRDADGVIDECVALVFRAPHSYTGEDTVELSLHGGVYLLRRTLRALYAAGARPAEAGEFTRRAFENGKLDLAAAESVMSLISADGRLAAKTALAAKEGSVFRCLDGVKQSLLATAAQFSAYVDYPDDDIPALTDAALSATLADARQTLRGLLQSFDAGRVLREGIDTVIVGSPNVGKSTLMNLLAGCERSIVTPIAGTTRDIVEETVRIGEVTLHLSDTAGLRETADAVEAIGVEKARRRMEHASLVLAVFDGSVPLTAQDRALIAALEGETAVAVINKTDLGTRLDTAALAPFSAIVPLSAKTGDGMERLTAAIEKVTGICRLQSDTVLLQTERQRRCAAEALSAIEEAENALKIGMTPDAVSVCIDSAVAAVLSLTGERTTEAVVDEVFRRFCVGK